MTRPRVVFLGTGGALNPERYQAAVLVECGDTRVRLEPLLLTQSLRAFRAGVSPCAVTLYALPGSAAVIRSTLAAAAGERRLAGQLTWVTPRPGARLTSPRASASP